MQLRIQSLRTQRGDTIMEVLIAVAVLSFVLISALTLSNRTSQATRQAQERGEGSGQTQSQMELLKTYLAKNLDLSALPASGKFCMKADAKPTPVITGNIPVDAQQENFSAIDTAIAGDAQYAACKTGDFYYTYIERQGDTFTVHTRWSKVNGQGIEESSIVHRLYPDLAAEGQDGNTINLGCTIHESYNDTGGGCTPCPYGTLSLGGYSRECVPIPGHIIVAVQKIPPINGGTAGSFTPPCSDPGIDTSSVPLKLSRTGDVQTALSTKDFSIIGTGFGQTYTAEMTSLPTGFSACYSTSQSVTAAPIEIPPYNERNVTFKIYPNCENKTFDNYVLEDDPDTYYADQTGWGPTYYTTSTRRGDLDGYFASTNGTTTTFDSNGSNVFSLNGQSGLFFLIFFKVSAKKDGTTWYNIWEATPHNDKIFGDPYYHGQKSVNHPFVKSICP